MSLPGLKDGCSRQVFMMWRLRRVRQVTSDRVRTQLNLPLVLLWRARELPREGVVPPGQIESSQPKRQISGDCPALDGLRYDGNGLKF